MRNAAQTND